MDGLEPSLYFLHFNTSGRPQTDDAPASAMAVFTFTLRNFHFLSASFISTLIDMDTTYQVCYGFDCHPGGDGIWLM